MNGYLPNDSKIEYCNGYSIASLTGLITKYPTIRSETKDIPKLPHADFIFNRGSPASRVEPTVLSEVLACSPRLASREWIIFDDPQPSCYQSLFEGLVIKSTLPSVAFLLIIIAGV